MCASACRMGCLGAGVDSCVGDNGDKRGLRGSGISLGVHLAAASPATVPADNIPPADGAAQLSQAVDTDRTDNKAGGNVPLPRRKTAAPRPM